MSTMLKTSLIAGIAFIILGIAMNFAPTMLSGFESLRTAGNVAQYTGLTTVVQFGPTLIILGFVIAIGVVGFMGLKLWKR